MDPLNRKANSNNSLLAIWIANMGATFFGGMTNLDGLAKSTTNTVAGAVTKTIEFVYFNGLTASGFVSHDSRTPSRICARNHYGLCRLENDRQY